MTTYVEQEVNPYFGILSLITLIIFGFFSVVYLPLAFFLTKNAVHRCSRCLMKMGEKSCYGLPEDYSQPIWHFRLGKCSVIIARVWAILAAFALLSAGCFYIYMRPNIDLNRGPLYHHNEESFELQTSWPQFLEDCGGE